MISISHHRGLPDLPRLCFEFLVRAALAEDVGSGDVTTTWVVPAVDAGEAVIAAKAPGVVAGLQVALCVFEQAGGLEVWRPEVSDGASVAAGDIIVQLTGPVRTILTGERVALNFLQRMSGVATLTRRFVQAVEGTSARIVDTRKTTPGLRALEKYAVRCGGGANHRLGLYDAVLIKDNHIEAAGSVSEAVRRARLAASFLTKLEVEAKSLREVEEALESSVEVIMLDNMGLEEMSEAVRRVGHRALVEASGNVSLATVRAVAETGVDLISVGSLTHSAPALDLSLKLRRKAEET